MSRKNLRRDFVHLMFVLPAVVFFLVIYIIPFIQGIPYSFTNWNGVSKTFKFVGLGNYKALFINEDFRMVLGNTLYFTVFYLILCNAFGLLFALKLCGNTRFNAFLRSVFFIPFVVALVTTAFIWRYLYSDVYSVLLHLPSPLGIMNQAMMGIVFNAVWRDTGYCMIIYIAALQTVPIEYYEAADMDGAGKFRKFFSITLPSIMPAFTANITLILAWGLKLFDYPMAATSGGPGRVTMSVAMYVYNNQFSYMKAGYGQAAAILMTIIMVIMSTVVNRLLRAREVEA
jgi:raffinose/stachyose/melibiose transport system permease protein